MKQSIHIKRIIGQILLSLGLVFVLGSATTQVRAEDEKLPLITIHGTGDITRGEKPGAFVLNMHPVLIGGMYVNIRVSGTAIPGVDYVHLISPAHIGQSGYGVLLVQTLPDRRAPALRRSCFVIVTLEPGPGYVVGEPNSARITIEP